LRFVARAITPPGRNRRFDARFFAVFDDAIAATIDVPDDELQEPAWLRFAEARAHDLPRITQTVLNRIEARLLRDPDLTGDDPIPFYFARRGALVEERL
jgi:8-oxo-dGTP pyrophosphatase MutT (NUDIX family)